jgi:hypothetical protein
MPTFGYNGDGEPLIPEPPVRRVFAFSLPLR